MTGSVPNFRISAEKLSSFGENTARRLRIDGEIKAARVARTLLTDLAFIRRTHDALSKAYGGGAEVPKAAEWLLDNGYLAQREGRTAAEALKAARKLRRCAEGAVLSEACGALVRSGGGEVNEERIELFVVSFQRVLPLSRAELALLMPAIKAALISELAAICREPEGKDGEIAAVFSSLRLFSTLDISELLERVDLAEQLLRQDPAGIYPGMDERSRDRYRRELTRLAKKTGTDELRAAKTALDLAAAAEKGIERHVGYWLFGRPLGTAAKSPSGGPYIAANILLTLFFSLFFGFLTRSAAAALLLLLPVSELTKNLIDFFVLKCVPPRFIPRMELENGVPGEGKTVCVISALLSKPEAGPALARALEEFRCVSRGCGENLMFGVLADLPEADEKSLPDDALYIEAAQAAVDGLNEKYGGGFYLFARRRTYYERDRRWIPRERKRGAIGALARLVSGAESELAIVSGDAARLAGARYILTLDSDTRLSPGAAKQLIGAMLHPLNRPVVDEKRGVVTSGYGIIHPRMGVELPAAIRSDFARIFAGQGGTDPYGSSCGELCMDLFDRGGFAGKGIIDVNALRLCTESLPDNLILSHDAVEGALLHGGYMSDVELTDGFPSSPLSYFKRMHRWTRGDWQNIAFILGRRGRRLSDEDRWKLTDSLRRSLVAPMTFLAFMLGLLFPARGLAAAAAAALLAVVSRLLLTLAQSAVRPEAEFKVRYHSTVIHGAGGLFMQTALRLVLLPLEAWVCASAICTSLWRMLVSRRNLLAWQTAAQSDSRSKDDLFAYARTMWLSLLAGAALLLFSASVIGRALGVVWLLSPLVARTLGKPAPDRPRINEPDRAYLEKCAADIWRYFERFCTASDNWLPPDNWQEQPPVGLAHRSSPTNIGLGLLSALAAMDFGLAEREKGLALIENMLGTVEKLPKWHGHLYNWYDTETLKSLRPEYVSTVDSGNLAASLVALRAGLIEYGRADLAARAAALYGAMDFTPLYDKRRRLFHIGFDLSSGALSKGWYDLMSSEARLTGYLAIAKGDVPPRHWRQLSRALVQKDRYRGMASWTGTMFEYLMPELFLPLCPESLIWESAKFCLYAQKKRVSGGEPWGASESAFFSLDPSLSYRYKAHGVSALALKRGMDEELVISPYSSFLALAVEPRQALQNLRKLEALGAVGSCGFWEAVDFTPSRCRFMSGELVRCVMSHHAGMSIVAIANCLMDGVMQRRFMSDPAMAAYRGFIEEKVPVGGVLMKRRGSEPPEKPARSAAASWEKSGTGTDLEHPECCLLSNGVYGLLVTESGLSAASAGGIGLYRGSKTPLAGPQGLSITLEADGALMELLPRNGGGALSYSWAFSGGSALISAEGEGLRTRCVAAVSARDAAEVRLVEIEALAPISGWLCIEFEPMLARAEDYENHPAFWRLGLFAELREGALLLRRLPRGKLRGAWLCLASDRPMEVTANETGAPLGWLSAPRVRARVPVDIPKGGVFSCRFALGCDGNSDNALAAAQRALGMGPADFADLSPAAAKHYGLASRELAAAMEMVSPLAFPRPQGPHREGREALWKFGLSGDLPIICAEADGAEQLEEAGLLIRRHALLSLCGLKSDLVFLTGEGGDYLRPASRAISDILAKLGLETTLGAPGGVHIADRQAGAAVIRSSAAVAAPFSRPERSVSEAAGPLIKNPRRRKGGEVDYQWIDEGFRFTVNGRLPVRAWSNVLANRDFGFIAADSGCGNMWHKNARECRINRWGNDPGAIRGDETLDVMHQGRRVSLFADEDEFERRVSFGLGWASWELILPEARVKATAFVPWDANARVLIIEGAPGEVLWQTGLVLGADEKDAQTVETSVQNGALSARNARSPYPEDVFYTMFSAEPEGFTCDYAAWLRGALDGRSGAGLLPCFAASLPAGDVRVIVSGCDDEERLRALAAPGAALDALRRTRAHWQSECGRLRVKTPDEGINRLMNGWAVYQSIACRLMARSSLYQSGGAFGFRDQLQDAVNLILIDPALARARILDCCRHQYIEGDVMHWWHPRPDGDRGVRTRCSDDLLWLAWAVAEYVEKTGDRALLGECAPYLVSPVLAEGEENRYERPETTPTRETVLGHATRALGLALGRGLGEHGLLLMGEGDWNDGMDAVGKDGRGESVWLSWFFAHTARRFAAILDAEGEKSGAAALLSAAKRVGRAADRAWDGEWYLRGYYDNGAPLGSVDSQGCRIDAIAQSWAVLCAESTPEKRERALDAALSRLFDREIGLVRLFDPPFADGTEDAGYIKSYGPGFRENGGQYTHGAIWLAEACLKNGREADGTEILRKLAAHDTRLYQAEPFVIPADVYSNPDRYGMAGWTWYTGSSGWYFRVVAESLLGLRLENGRLRVTPHLPADWAGYEALWTDPEGRTQRIEVRDGAVSVDGEIYK